MSLTLPAGKVIAVVGENGAGKTTMVKLLARMYEPDEGAILVDDEPLARIAAVPWRRRLAGAFQDFFRFEFVAAQAIGLGDLADRRPEGGRARCRARWSGRRDSAAAFGARHAARGDLAGGAELSFGQWQKLALARGSCAIGRCCWCSMNQPRRSTPKPSTRFRALRRGRAGPAVAGDGRITILVSHRFSTVRMADLIVVLDGSRLAEVGTHEELLARKGQYAQLYNIQAAAYH